MYNVAVITCSNTTLCELAKWLHIVLHLPHHQLAMALEKIFGLFSSPSSEEENKEKGK